MSTKVAIYSRFSVDDKSQTASIDDQVRVCERLAERERFTVVARFSDAAISGGTAKRPGYQAMLAAMRRGEFAAIVAEDLKRLWREQAEQWRCIKELQDRDVHVITVSGVDSRQQNFEVIAAVMGAAGELERKEAAYRTRRGQEGKARQGLPTGGKSYGYIAARDSGTRRIEINEKEAEVVREIFALYASGMAPRAIAAKLNTDKVPSPGSSWNRTVRRKSGWLASAIHGDQARGTGILNNRRYAGVIVWGRSQWKRGAADSSVRRVRMLAKPLHEQIDERLRIVPQDLWERVKARQAQQRKSVGVRVREGLRKRAGGAGRKGKYVFTGLLQCAECDAAFTLRNRDYYCCASYWNGDACTNTINVSRKLVQDIIVSGIREDLQDPEVIGEVEKGVRAAIREQQRGKPANGKRIAELRREVENLVAAIASGALRSSPALAQRLQAAEAELARLEALQRVKPGAIVIPDAHVIRKAYGKLLERLDEVLTADPERGREALRQVMGGERIKLTPDPTRKFLIAEYALGLVPLLPGQTNADLMVAGAGFEPATFGL